MADEETISGWLAALKLQQYESQFLAAGYDDASLIPELNEADLDAIGVTLPGHRKRLLMHGARLQRALFSFTIACVCLSLCGRAVCCRGGMCEIYLCVCVCVCTRASGAAERGQSRG